MNIRPIFSNLKFAGHALRLNQVRYCARPTKSSKEENSLKYLVGRKKTNDPEPEEQDNTPVQYLKSPARFFTAEMSRTGVTVPRLWYEPYVIMASLVVFMVYFTILREENDIDKELSMSLYDRVEGLEEHQLRLALKFNQEHDLETEDIVKRLKELEMKKQRSENNLNSL